MRNISDKICKENENTNFMLNNFFSGNRAVYETMWKIMAKPDRPQMTTQYGACALHATDTYPEYVILIAFPRQQWLRERVSMLRLHVYCLSCSFLHFEF
jgi:hypothetical protein